jgi:16S rRNA (guanine527-N7)-methyltransferase
MLAARLNQLLHELDSPFLPDELTEKFEIYLQLLLKWNARTNLTAIRDEDEILRRHFVESILCAQFLPSNISSLLDFGSGAGFPGLPIALIRNEIAVTLAESQNKKAAFLREAIRTLGLNTKVHSSRAETLRTESLTAPFDCVTLRAVDNMAQALPAAIQLLSPQGWLAVMTTSREVESIQQWIASPIAWQTPLPLPKGTDRVLLLGQTSPIPIDCPES